MDGYEQYTAKNIVNKSGELIGSLFEFISDYDEDSTSDYDL